MPILPNQRQERFCQLIKQGLPPRKAYPLAGYKPDNGAPYRLSANVRIKRRLRELTRHIAVKTRITVESLSDDLARIMQGAEAAEQFAAAKGAVDSLARLHGHMIDRKESGAPGDFAGLQTPEEIMEKVRSELGEEAAALLAASFAQAEDPVLEQPVDPTNEGSGAVN